MKITIRAARPDDTEAIIALDQGSFTQPWSPQTMREAVEKAQVGEYIALVAESAGELCGFVVAWNVGEEGEIATIAVAESARGQGIGRKLLEAALHEATRRGATQMFLEVRPANAAAIRLYENCGFTTVGLRKNYYRDGDDAVVMRWEEK